MKVTVQQLTKYGPEMQELRDGWMTCRGTEPLDWFPTKARAVAAAKMLNAAAVKVNSTHKTV